ncbi:mechanosensitive ion channel family protein [Akkermansiaceae bacterium]|nr:mechanosensitive ion channel family protein [Akkermansiaceae bacterium]
MIRLPLFLACALTLFICPALSQENTLSPDPRISTDILALSLDPLTEEELETQTAIWMAALKESSTRIAENEIRLLSGEGDASAISAELLLLRETKAEILTRTQIVLEAYELKGGDASKQMKYLAAVRGIKPANNDVGTRVHAFRTWLGAEDGGMRILLGSIKFIVVLAGFWLLSVFAGKLIRRSISRQANISALLKVFINKMASRIILGIGIIVALGTVGVNVGAALALIGGGAFILAFALQDTLSNFAAGMMLLIYRPFDVGSAVEIGGIKGKVDSVSMVSTTILTFDNQKVLVPNKKVWGETITNITGMDTRRVDMVFGIGYSDDIGKAEEIIARAVSEHPLILSEPEPNIGVHELADSSVNIRCWPWAATSDFLTVRTEITRRVKEDFDAAGISIPFPQRDIHFHGTGTKPAGD